MVLRGRSFESFSTGCKEILSSALTRIERKKGGFRTYSCSRNTHEADTHQDTSDRDLVISEFDTLKVLNRESPGGNQTIQSENLVHLNRSDESAATLTNNVDD